MHLMRIGPPGAEKPIVRVDDESYVDVSDLVTDFDAAYFADEAVGVAIEIVGFEHARHDRRRARILRLQRFDQLEVLRVEDATHDRERFGRDR